AAELVAVGEPVTVTLHVAGVTDLAGYQAGIDWDDALLAYDGVTALDWIASSGRRMELIDPVVTGRSLDFLVYTAQPSPSEPVPGVTGEGDLAAIRFVALHAGRATITLRQLLLTTTGNQPIAVERSNAIVTIGSNTIDPTPTTPPAPTSTPDGEPHPHIYLPYAARRG
ncbi:MAG: cohesin domain-containing protein, partial [Ardenticatenales bacterium]